MTGFWYPCWLYNTLLLNDRLPQGMFDHPCYLPFLLLSNWLRTLHDIGLIRIDALSGLLSVSDVPACNAVWMNLTQAGRVFSLLLAIGLVAASTYLLRVRVCDWRIGPLGASWLPSPAAWQ